MDERRETIADILEELRSGEYAPLAYRFEAAWKREKATTEKSSAVGDAAKLREALEVLLDVVCSWDDHLPPVIREGEYREAYRKAEAALAAPPRNCDKFGTDNTEASLAYEEFCDRAEVEESVNGAISWLLSLNAD